MIAADPITFVKLGTLGVPALLTIIATGISVWLLRRTMAGLSPALGICDDKAAARVAQYLDWTGQRAQQEVAEYREYVRRFQPPLDETF